MYLLETLLAFLVFLLFISTYIPQPPDIDYTIYSYMLAEDVWRVLYIRHAELMFLNPFVVVEDLKEMSEQSSLCISAVVDVCNKNTATAKYKIIGNQEYAVYVGK